MVVLEIPYPTPEMKIPVITLVIQIPASFLYESTQLISWRYEPKSYRMGQENQPLVINEPNVTTIARHGGMTRNDRVFALRIVEPLAKAKGKDMASNTPSLIQNNEAPEGSLSPKAAASKKEVEDFL